MTHKERHSNGRLPGLWRHREQILGMLVTWKSFRGSSRVRGQIWFWQRTKEVWTPEAGESPKQVPRPDRDRPKVAGEETARGEDLEDRARK